MRKIEQKNKELITDRRRGLENNFKPRSQSFEKENKLPVRRPIPAPVAENRYVVDRKFMPPRQLKI